MAYNANLPADTTAPAEIRENFRALKEDKIVAADTANTATKLETARTISLTGDATGSATFDGSADVSITVDVTSADTAAACSGNAATATKLATARTIAFTGDATGSLSFDGSKDVSSALTLANSGVTAGTYKSVTVDAKGRVTAGTNPTTLAGYGITDALPLSGGTMSGAIAMGGNKITGLVDGMASGDAVNYGQFGASLTASGYQKLPGGLIIQWGTYNRTTAAGTNEFVPLNYPIPFPNNVFSIAVTTGTSLTTAYYGADLYDNSSFKMGVVESSNNMSVSIKWIAIGN